MGSTYTPTFFSFKYDGESKTLSVNRGRDANDVTVCQGVEEDRALATIIKQWALISKRWLLASILISSSLLEPSSNKALSYRSKHDFNPSTFPKRKLRENLQSLAKLLNRQLYKLTLLSIGSS